MKELRINRKINCIREVNSAFLERIIDVLNDLDDEVFLYLLHSGAICEETFQTKYGKINISCDTCAMANEENIPCQFYEGKCEGVDCANYENKFAGLK